MNTVAKMCVLPDKGYQTDKFVRKKEKKNNNKVEKN